MEATAKLKHLKGSPRKARLVIDLIRGRNVSQALNILKFTDKRAADPIAKTLRSAIANATFLAEKQNIAIDPDDLFVKTCFVDMGAHKNRRRMRPAPQGRAYREQRHYCHITIQVSSDAPKVEDEKVVKAKTAETKKVATKKTTAKKAEPVKETKKAKKEETVIEEMPTPTAEPVETKSPKATEASKQVAEDEVKKEASAETTAEKNESKPADEAQEKINEDLERQ